MKKFVFWLLLSVPFHTYSQFRDDFSDNRFTNVPTLQERTVNWTGDIEKFVVNDALQLQLSAPKETGSAQLRTASALSANASWEWWMKFGFNPTSSNYAKVYLCSDSENLAESLHNMYVRIGYTNKNLCLIMKEGAGEKTLITGPQNRLNVSSPALFVKVTLTRGGTLSLYSKLDGETDYTLEGSYRAVVTLRSSYFGILCYYTSTRSNLFYFDDFEIQTLTEEDGGDEEDGDDGGNNDDDGDDDGNENDGNDGNENTISYGEAVFGDVVFNEVMANPADGQPEYVELYNRSGKKFQVKGWKFYYGDKPYALPDVVVNPLEYIVLCKNTAVQSFPQDVNAVGVTSFPRLANTGKLLYLENNESTLISWFEYSDKMYGSNEKKAGGWSLEAIDPSNFSNGVANWIASIAPEGHTAGKINSTAASNPDEELPLIKSVEMADDNRTITVLFTKPMAQSPLIDPEAYVPDNPDYRIVDIQISYPKGDQVVVHLNQALPQGTMLHIRLDGIYDISGIPLSGDKQFTVGSGDEAEVTDIVINEVMFNAPASSEEYIELYNRSEKTIDLRYLSLVTRNTGGGLTKIYPLTTNPIVLYPEEYIAITKDVNAVCSYFTCRESSLMMELSTTPVLNNTSGDVVLLNNRNNEVIDEFVYNEKMHSDAIKDKKGVALERIDVNAETNDASNWHSASSLSGFGTPGYENSQHQPEGVTTGAVDKISIAYPELSLGGDAYEIHYLFAEPGNRCRAFLYDAMGRMVNIIANNELLGTEGKLVWYGRNTSGQKLHSGVYIVYVEVITSAGNVKKFKLPAVVK